MRMRTTASLAFLALVAPSTIAELEALGVDVDQLSGDALYGIECKFHLPTLPVIARMRPWERMAERQRLPAGSKRRNTKTKY